MKNYLLAAIICLSSTATLTAQNIFKETFTGCVTDQFILESDVTTAQINSIQFVEAFRNHLGEELIKKIKGELKLQIIVDLEGNSCLLSLENKTNVKTKKLKLKSWIDEEIKWEIPSKKVGAVIVLKFTDNGIYYQRLGMNANKGWHTIE